MRKIRVLKKRFIMPMQIYAFRSTMVSHRSIQDKIVAPYQFKGGTLAGKIQLEVTGEVTVNKGPRGAQKRDANWLVSGHEYAEKIRYIRARFSLT